MNPSFRSGDSCSSVARGKSLGADEWMELMHALKLGGKGFEKSLRRCHLSSVPPEHNGALEGRLLPPHFLVALATLAFQRANSQYLEELKPGSKPAKPLPDCLVELLQLQLVPLAKARQRRQSNLGLGLGLVQLLPLAQARPRRESNP